MYIAQKLVLWTCSLFIAVAEWLRGWPQGCNRPLPDGYAKVYLPLDLIPAQDLIEGGGTWSMLEAAGVVRLPDDWVYDHLRPVALPPGWLLDTCSGNREVLRDQFDRVRAQIHYVNYLPERKLKDGCTITLVARYYTDYSYVGDYELVGRALDRDTGEVLYTTPEYRKGYNGIHCDAELIVRQQAMAWLDENRSGWRHVNDYRVGGVDVPSESVA